MFLVLCKGLKSIGKILIGLTVVPLIMFAVITGKLLYIIDYATIQVSHRYLLHIYIIIYFREIYGTRLALRFLST